MGNVVFNLDDIESEIRQGKVKLLVKALGYRQKYTPAQSVRLANLARRGGYCNDALKLLAPLMAVAEPTPNVIVEYCMSLHEIGVKDEALEKIREIDSPESLIFQVHSAFSLWDYQRAIEILKKYVQMNDISKYQLAVAKTNLAAAHVALENFALGKSMAEKALVENDPSWTRLNANLNEILAQASLGEGALQQAETYLESALKFQMDDPLVDSLFIDKWKAIILAKRKGCLSEVNSIERRARERGQWETVRAIALHKLKLKFTQLDLDRLHYGTPFPAFRKRLRKEFGAPSESFQYPQRTDDYWDVAAGFDHGGQRTIIPTSKMGRLLLALLSDFFQPLNAGRLFSHIYRGELFSVDVSAGRVRQLIRRLRRSIEQAPFSLIESDGYYSLSTNKDFSFLLSDVIIDDQTEMQLNTLKNIFSSSFTAKDVEGALSVSRSSVRRLLKSGVDKKWLKKYGVGRAITYQFISEE